MKQTLVALSAATLIVICFFYMLGSQRNASPSSWPKEMVRYSNAVSGSIRVSDDQSKETLFWYYDDQDVNPVSIERTAEGEWTVKFKKRK